MDIDPESKVHAFTHDGTIRLRVLEPRAAEQSVIHQSRDDSLIRYSVIENHMSLPKGRSHCRNRRNDPEQD